MSRVSLPVRPGDRPPIGLPQEECPDMLRSQLFRGNTRLERCAVSHAAHVTPGSTGDFVSKIQEALVILDDAVFTGTDVSTQTYGTSTADAVLEYKTARNIV